MKETIRRRYGGIMEKIRAAIKSKEVDGEPGLNRKALRRRFKKTYTGTPRRGHKDAFPGMHAHNGVQRIING